MSPDPSGCPLLSAAASSGAPLNTESVPLDVGYSDSIPEAIRRAVILRDKHRA